MTTRPGGRALAWHRHSRGKRYCNLVEVTRPDGAVLRWSDHDRILTFDGQKYDPAVLAYASAESRRVGLESSPQEQRGLIDGDSMTIPDLLGRRYSRAIVRHVVTDWQYPWLTFYTAKKRIRSVSWGDNFFSAQLDSLLLSRLERQSGGRFAGINSRECNYQLGDGFCRANISSYEVVGAQVGTVHDERTEVSFSTVSWPTAQVDQFYRYGDIEWLWGPRTAWGTTTGATSTTTLTSAGSPGWTTDEFVGDTVRVLSAPNGPVVGWSVITANDANSVTYADENGNMSGHSSGVDYDICPDSANRGAVSSFESYTASTRRVELFVPTHFDIVAGDSGIAQVGCDKLFSTCRDKFSNQLRFPQGHLQPRPSDQLEVVQ